jgi:hypothetical protein
MLPGYRGHRLLNMVLCRILIPLYPHPSSGPGAQDPFRFVDLHLSWFHGAHDPNCISDVHALSGHGARDPAGVIMIHFLFGRLLPAADPDSCR